jgi:hypothetical protein
MQPFLCDALSYDVALSSHTNTHTHTLGYSKSIIGRLCLLLSNSFLNSTDSADGGSSSRRAAALLHSSP